MAKQDTLDDALARIDQELADCRKTERRCIEQINDLAPQDVRGETPEISDQIKKLDGQRRQAAQRRRELQGERSELIGVAGFLARRKTKGSRALARLEAAVGGKEADRE